MYKLPLLYTPEQEESVLADFLAAYPVYRDTAKLDDLRANDYERLDKRGHTYLDYTGGGIYASSQLREHMELLQSDVYGNPHSSNPTSQAVTKLDEHARQYVLEYFNASPDEYEVIFTLNASGALKLVGESYPFNAGNLYALTFDNHNSVNGIREYAKSKGAEVVYIPVVPPDLRVDEAKLYAVLDNPGSAGHNLFAYPAQSNFSGVQHPLEWIAYAQARGWDVLVDFAAYAPTNVVDLGRWHPDFVCLSFYKIFGYPTGIGCLIARKSAVAKLQRPWFAGGTITVASVQAGTHTLHEGEASFEDGTINYLNIPAVEIGLRHICMVGMDVIHQRVVSLAGWLIDNLLTLRHSNGAPLIRLYGPTSMDRRGSTITINFYDPHGKLLEFRHVEAEANQELISLRTGCFCNPGAGEAAEGFTKEEILSFLAYHERMTFEEFIEVAAMNGRNAGALRVSLGLVSNFHDTYRFMAFAERFVDRLAERG
ncbi:MAG: aminotransferase class V-fold PLP-dependent enzyme [Chloroflexota bacterium]